MHVQDMQSPARRAGAVRDRYRVLDERRLPRHPMDRPRFQLGDYHETSYRAIGQPAMLPSALVGGTVERSADGSMLVEVPGDSMTVVLVPGGIIVPVGKSCDVIVELEGALVEDFHLTNGAMDAVAAIGIGLETDAGLPSTWEGAGVAVFAGGTGGAQRIYGNIVDGSWSNLNVNEVDRGFIAGFGQPFLVRARVDTAGVATFYVSFDGGHNWQLINSSTVGASWNYLGIVGAYRSDAPANMGFKCLGLKFLNPSAAML